MTKEDTEGGVVGVGRRRISRVMKPEPPETGKILFVQKGTGLRGLRSTKRRECLFSPSTYRERKKV